MDWYAVRVKSNFDQTVAQALRGKGYEELSPVYRTLRQWSDRRKVVHRPLFPGYVFCRLDVNNRLPVLTTPGVIGIVGYGNSPGPVSPEEIDGIRMILNARLPVSQWPYLPAGGKVQIIRGPLAGLEGVLVCSKSDYRLVVSMHLLQRSVAVEIDGGWIRSSHPSMGVDAVAPAAGGCVMAVIGKGIDASCKP